MYRSALRSTPRAANALFRQSALRTTAAPRRFASTSLTEKKRSWKGTALRWGVAVGAVYWYSTSPLFADDTQPQTVSPPPQFSEDDLPTVEAVVEQKRREAEARLAAQAAAEAAKPKDKPKKEVAPPDPAKETTKTGEADSPAPGSGVGGAEDLEAEAGSQGAFNPETGEINWDCPCLGGMAHGPCGEEFKAAFSCFVYSKEEPKGMDCIDKFQNMQNCFREHPEVYADELADEDDDGTEAEGAPEAGAATASAKTDASPRDAASPAAPSTEIDGDAKPVAPAKESPATSKPTEQNVATKPKQA